MSGASAAAAPGSGGIAARGSIGPWRVQCRLGPTTWRAVEVGTGVRVVVRAGLDGTPAATAVRAEAAALAALGSHGPRHLPGLPRPAGEVAAGGLVAVATEVVEGPTVAELLAAGVPASWGSVARLLAPAASALAALHEAGWVHGDVSPANVVASEAGAVLVDLGCARPVADAGATGTPGWVAPEVRLGGRATPAADVWALASIAGALARAGRAGLPAEAALALARPLAGDPLDRPTAAQLAAALRVAGEAALRSEALISVPPEPRDAPTRDYGPRPPGRVDPVPARPPRAPAPAVAAVAVLVAVGTWWVTRPASATPDPAIAGAACERPLGSPGR